MRCDLTDLLVANCAHCRKLPDPHLDHDRTEVEGPWFEARYDGRCVNCGTEFVGESGQMIRRVVTGGYLGDCCRPACAT